MRIKGLLLALLSFLSALVPLSASAEVLPDPPAGPVFNQVQLKVLADNDFSVFMGNDLGVTRLFYENNVSWYSQVDNIQLLDLFPQSGETFVYIVPMGGNGTYLGGGAEDWSGVLNNIPLLDYPGGEVAVGRRVVDAKDLFHDGYLLFNKHLTNFETSAGAIADGKYSVALADLQPASQNIIWSPATRTNNPLITDPIFGCPVSCSGTRFTPTIPDGAWDIPDASVALFRYPLSSANLPVSPGDRQVSVTWKDPSAGGTVDNYLIEYKESSEPDASFKTFGTVAGTVRTSTVTGLTNGIAYTLRVTANNAGGSASSLGRSVVPTGTPSRPSNQSYGAGDGSVSINFSPPENDGGMAVTNYAYSIDDGLTWITRQPASTISPLTISGLTNFTDYSVRLKAVNPFGAGAASLPIAVKPGIVATRTLTYVAGTLATIQGLAAGRTFVAGEQFTVANGPTRSNFTFTGWKDGNVSYSPGDVFTIGAGNPNLTAQWVQDSLLGTDPASRSRVLTWNIIAGQGIDTTVSAGSDNAVRIQIPANALPAGTEVIFWRLFNDALAKAKISSANSYFVNMALSWSLGDDVATEKIVPTASTPIVVTITNSSIVSGATAWQIIGDSVRVIGQAETNGVLALRFTEDPVITAANVAPLPSFGTPVATADGFEVDLTNFDPSYTWEVPSVSVGSLEIVSTVGSVKKMKITGLTVGQSATITQRNFFNSIYQTGTVTGSAIAAPMAPTTSSPSNPVVIVAPIEVAPPTPATLPGRRFAVTGFEPGSWVLSPNMKKSIDGFLKGAGQPRKISCTGFTMGLTVLKVDQALANRRALETCKYLMAKNPSVAVGATKGITTKNASSNYRRTVVTLGF